VDELAQEGSSNVGLEMLSAAHVLLNSDRVTDQRDLLISTCLEALSDGPSPASKLLHEVQAIWPGTHLDLIALETALSEAREMDLVGIQETIHGSQDWALARAGQAEIDSTRAWFADAMDRLARQIQDRARDDFGELAFEAASQWARLLQKVFSDEIARSASAYAGGVERGAAGNVRPMMLDGQSMLRALDDRGLASGTADFLKGCLLAAVDESDLFGNELVGQVATSCVLHSIAAGRGRAAVQKALGSLEGQRIVLDTPILVSYLGSLNEQQHLRRLLRQAVDQKMELIAPEHVFSELDDVIDRVSADHLDGLVQALKAGTNPRSYALTVNEQILELFLDGVESKQYGTWHDFTQKVRQLPDEFRALGVSVREHGNKQRDNVGWLAAELTDQIAESGSGRGQKPIARDAESIEMVWRARRRQRRYGPRGSLWPGGWLVSRDRQINPTYRRVDKDDTEPLLLTPSQWATLMSETAPAAEVADLVEAAASYLRQESMYRIATRYPPATALTLAKSLSGEYVSSTDQRVAQFASLSDLLDKTASGETVTGERIASELVSRRSDRLAAAGKEQLALTALERTRLDAVITRSTTVVTEEHDARVAAESRAAQLEAQQALGGRRVFAAVAITLGLSVAVLLAVLHFWIFMVATLAGTAVFANQSRDWTKDRTLGHAQLLWALIPGGLSLVVEGVRAVAT